MTDIFVNKTFINLHKLKSCLFQTQKLVQRMFSLDKFHCIGQNLNQFSFLYLTINDKTIAT
jgi:hypothetical protein